MSLRLPQYISCDESVVLGDDCKLYCWDSYNGKRFAEKPEIRIGKRVHATRALTLQCARKIIIEDDVLLASNISLIDYNHGMSPLTDSYLENPLSLSDGILIGQGSWIGNNVLIVGGVTLGKKCIIGAGSVVTKDIPPYSVAVGNPAHVIKRYDFEQNKWVAAGN
ncbi:acyltransferase [Bifidobacterium callimiconis]|uniref:acyltransferase n=1 Tax=Bifidobacterium callimiconis TaxID=2306973 RepID=UPI001F0A3131|nr:acyltransferase [Bifidobacterium callimiconis]